MLHVPSNIPSRFQSTRPHGARHVARPVEYSFEVSIHAPARGATSRPDTRIVKPMFQSTRPHGARRDCAGNRGGGGKGFNPRARTGRDFPAFLLPAPQASFNPRARTGRDGRGQPTGTRPVGFNPRARTGRDVAVA